MKKVTLILSGLVFTLSLSLMQINAFADEELVGSLKESIYCEKSQTFKCKTAGNTCKKQGC